MRSDYRGYNLSKIWSMCNASQKRFRLRPKNGTGSWNPSEYKKKKTCFLLLTYANTLWSPATRMIKRSKCTLCCFATFMSSAQVALVCS